MEPERIEATPFRLGDWVVLPARHQLRHVVGDRTVDLEPKVMELLQALARAEGEVVSRDELHAVLWPGTFVTDKALTGAVAKLRKALEDDVAAPRYVATIPKRGYRILAAVEDPPREATSIPTASSVAEAASGRRLVAAMLLLGFVLAAGTAWSRLAERPDPGPLAIRVTTEPGFELHPAISPGGETVAYAAADAEDNWDIYLSRPGSETALRLTDHPHRDVRPIWSPDGTRVAFMRFDDTSCRLMVMPALGGEPTQLAWCAEFVPAQVFWGPKPAWSPDGRFIAWPYREGPEDPVAVHFVDVATGSSHRVTDPPAWHADGSPVVSPDGRWLAFTRRGYGSREVWVVGLDESGARRGEAQQLTFEARPLMGHAWLSDSRNLLVSSQRDGTFSLWVYPIEGGAPRWLPAPGENLKEPSLSADDRRLVYEDWNYDENVWRADLGAAAIVQTSAAGQVAPGAATTASRYLASSLWDSEPSYSPDGSEIAFVSNRSGNFEVWIAAAEGGDPRRVTRLESGSIGPITWHPGGRTLLFEARPDGVGQIFAVASAGGPAAQVTTGAHENLLPSVAPDGRSLWFSSNRSGQWEIWRTALEGASAAGTAEQVTTQGGYGGRLTADGQTLVFARHGEPGLWAQPVGGGDARRIIDELRAGDFGNWTVHGRHVVYLRRTPDRGRGEVVALDLDTGRTRAVFEPDGTILASRRGLSVSPDGRYLLYTQMDDASSDLVVVEGLLE